MTPIQTSPKNCFFLMPSLNGLYHYRHKCSGAPHPGGVTRVVSAVSILHIDINVNMQKIFYTLELVKLKPFQRVEFPGECSDQGAAITETVCDPVRHQLHSYSNPKPTSTSKLCHTHLYFNVKFNSKA